MAVCLDNTYTNMGYRNSIKVCMLRKNPNCFIAGCRYHLSLADAYSGATGLEVEDQVVDVYYYFKKAHNEQV